MHLTQRSGVIYSRFYQRDVSQTLGDIKVTLTSNKSPYTASQNSHCYLLKTLSPAITLGTFYYTQYSTVDLQCLKMGCIVSCGGIYTWWRRRYCCQWRRHCRWCAVLIGFCTHFSHSKNAPLPSRVNGPLQICSVCLFCIDFVVCSIMYNSKQDKGVFLSYFSRLIFNNIR